MDSAQKHFIEQKCIVVALWVTRRAKLLLRGDEPSAAKRADRMVIECIAQLKEVLRADKWKD